MLRAAQARLALQGGRVAPALSRGLATEWREDPHVRTTEQEQGHIVELMQDPEEVARFLRQQQHKPYVYGISNETMADTIMRETLEAQQAELEARARAKGHKVLCEHGHEHDVCCGASAGEVEEGEV
ncbi:hypothetical protein ABPG75_003716 [Micractinium tetrahymenae]